MNFIFSKKALWAVVFAAAAIFAVTFAACDNGNGDGSPYPVYLTRLPGVYAGDAVCWTPLEGGTAKWVFADEKASVEAPPAGWYKVVSDVAGTRIAAASVKVVSGGSIAGALAADGTPGDLYELTFFDGSGTASTLIGTVDATTKTTLTGLGSASGKAVLTDPSTATAAVTVVKTVTNGTIANALGSDGTEDDIYEVTFINASGEPSILYGAVDGTTKTTLTGLGTLSGKAVLTDATTASYSAADVKTVTSGAIAGTSLTKGAVYEVSLIDANGALTEHYFEAEGTASIACPAQFNGYKAIVGIVYAGITGYMKW